MKSDLGQGVRTLTRNLLRDGEAESRRGSDVQIYRARCDVRPQVGARPRTDGRSTPRYVGRRRVRGVVSAR